MQVKLFGNWKTTDPDAEHSDHGKLLISFMEADPSLEPTRELLDLLRSEFLALDSYREQLENALNTVAGAMSRSAAAIVPKLEQTSGPHEQYAAGWNAGAYMAHANDAQAIRNALLECQAGVAK
jgi:hypothetical protein